MGRGERARARMGERRELALGEKRVRARARMEERELGLGGELGLGERSKS